MGQISVKTYAANGSLLNDNQQADINQDGKVSSAEYKDWTAPKDN
jgi:hypothetical protein